MFEPNPANYVSLARLARRFADVRVEPYGLAEKAGVATLYVPSYRGKVMSGLASFDRTNAMAWLSEDTVFGFEPEQLAVEEIPLSLRRLDDFQLEPDFIKIDVQGLEGRGPRRHGDHTSVTSCDYVGSGRPRPCTGCSARKATTGSPGTAGESLPSPVTTPSTCCTSPGKPRMVLSLS